MPPPRNRFNGGIEGRGREALTTWWKVRIVRLAGYFPAGYFPPMGH